MKVTKAPWTGIVQRTPVASDPLTPGFIVSTEALKQLAGRPLPGLDTAPFFVVPPSQVKSIFAYDKELDLVKSMAGLALGYVDPRLKKGVDAVWLIYGMAKLRDAMAKPDRDWGKIFFSATGLGLGAAGLVGGVYPNLKLGEAWSNGINLAVRSGSSIYEGKTPPINEMVLSQDKTAAVLIKLGKYAGLTLDPAPEFAAFKMKPLPVPK